MTGHRFYARILSFLFILSISSSGQVPQLINYQGRLLTGTNLVNGNVGLSLRLFNVPSGGASIYEDSNSVAVADGLYSTFIGDHPTNSLFLTALTNAAVYVEVAVNGTALAPRERLASVGYSLATRGLLVTTNNSVVVNPAENTIDPTANHSTIGGGEGNSIQTNAAHSVLGGGYQNSIQNGGQNSVLGGGAQNTLQRTAYYCFLGGGAQNSVQAFTLSSFLGGGYGNSIQYVADYSFLGGGKGNSIQTNAAYSVLGGGQTNTIRSDATGSTIGGGQINTIEPLAVSSTIGGGQANTIQSNAQYSTIGGGLQNTIGGFYSTIGGGINNVIQPSAFYSIIGGGTANNIGDTGWFDTIGGGSGNAIAALAQYATVPGGYLNVAGAHYSFAAGNRAKASHQGTFVWADSTAADFASTAANQFLIRASGGVGIGNPSPAAQLSVFAPGSSAGENTTTFGAPLIGANYSHVHFGTNGDWYIRSASANGVVILQDAGGNVGIGTAAPTNKLHVVGNVQATAFITSSDRNAKENFAAVDANDVLEKIAAMPISRWNFKTEPTVQHVGPMAQDFHAAFGLGQNDTTIATVDESGVAFAAIQELVRQNKLQQQEIIELRERLNALAP